VKLAETYERSLTEVFDAAGYPRSARGLYLQTDDKIIWRGLWVTFYRKGIRLAVQPFFAVFCPTASKNRGGRA
jgi:hypothetical protein